jgi:alanine racemase
LYAPAEETETRNRSGARMVEQGPWLDVDLGALVRNARRYAAEVGVPLLPMVKANGYGLGAVAVARALESIGPWGFGVATVAEGAALRASGIGRPILVFWPFVPASIDDYLAHNLRPAIGDPIGLQAWIGRTDRPFHLAIDSGMGRAGIRWHDEAAVGAARALLADAPGYEGVYTHFASADQSAEETERQWTRFSELVPALGAPPLIHAANSAGGQWGGRFAGTLCRPGIFLYGGPAGRLAPEPVATFSARVVAVRSLRAGDPVSYGGTWRAPEPCEVATIAAGYADGLLRSLSNRGLVHLRGRTAPIAGRVTMDMTMVALPPGSAAVGDQAVFYGGPLELAAQAERAGTIPYELLTAIGPRVIRRYSGMP